jgi:hypothetical protein
MKLFLKDGYQVFCVLMKRYSNNFVKRKMQGTEHSTVCSHLHFKKRGILTKISLAVVKDTDGTGH